MHFLNFSFVLCQKMFGDRWSHFILSLWKLLAIKTWFNMHISLLHRNYRPTWNQIPCFFERASPSLFSLIHCDKIARELYLGADLISVGERMLVGTDRTLETKSLGLVLSLITQQLQVVNHLFNIWRLIFSALKNKGVIKTGGIINDLLFHSYCTTGIFFN